MQNNATTRAGKPSGVGKGAANKEMPLSYHLTRLMTVVVVLVILLLVVALLFDAPLAEKANPAHPPNPAKAPWYFLGLQELVSHSAFIGGILVPTAIVIVLLLVPYIDRKPVGVGVWFARERWVQNTLFGLFVVAMVVLIIIGMYFRGESWNFVLPWAK
ncbi:menaquinol oxidoreductase [bacterium]|nr:menaquinol oxidoreductase [bacterium]